MFIPSIRIEKRNNPNPMFQRKHPIVMIKSAPSINPQQKLAELFEKKQEGALLELNKLFKPDQIKGFFLMGYIKRSGRNWEKTETGDKFISQFYRKPTEEEAEFGRYLASIGY